MKTTKYDRHRPRRSYKPEIQQTRVLAKKIAGATITEIAKSEGISRPTVRKILTDKQYQEIVRVHRQEVLDLIPGSIRTYKTALDGLELPKYLQPDAAKIEVMDGGEFKKKLEDAFHAGVERGMDSVKVATEVLKGTQILVTKQDVAAKFEDETKKKTRDELHAELTKEFQELAGQG